MLGMFASGEQTSSTLPSRLLTAPPRAKPKQAQKARWAIWDMPMAQERAKKKGLEAASDGGNDGNRVASLHGGLETFHVADIIVTHEDIHELVQIAGGVE